MQKLIDELSLYPGKDVIPTELAEKILPTFQVNSEEVTVSNPTADIVRAGEFTDSDGLTSATLYAVPATGKFYLTGFTLHHVADNTNDIWTKLNITIDGTAVPIAWLKSRGLLTYDIYPHDVVSLNLTHPVLVDQSTNITITRSAADTSNVAATIVGYTEAD